MAITPITPIPNNEPDAVPALWNTRYTEIDQNFTDLDQRATASTQELETARGDKDSLTERLAAMSVLIESASPDFQKSLAASVMFALDQAGVANSSIKDLKQLSQQEGQITITNRGVVSGCTATKSATATRNLDFVGGVIFTGGRKYTVPSALNAASVPPNTTSASIIVRAYLYRSSGVFKMAVTNIGEALPASAIHLYNITVPAGSTDVTDPKLALSTLTSVRRVEALFPRVFNSASAVTVSINTLRDTDYRIDFDVISFSGGACDRNQIEVNSRATNGFSFYLASEADNVVLRWRLSKLNN